MLAVEQKLAAIDKGERQAKGTDEQLELALLCLEYKKRYAAGGALL